MPDLRVGETYTLNQLGSFNGGAALTSEDRIVTGDLAWQRMTVGRLKLWLEESLEAGEITEETQVWVDSDPEGNGVHPMRAAVNLTPMKGDLLDDLAQDVEIPAQAVWFGVGY